MRIKLTIYNPGQNYLRKFSPSCPLSYATKLFPKRRLCGKKTPSPNSMLLPTNAQGSGFLLNTQQHCFQGKGEREEPVQLRCLKKCCPSIQFSQHFFSEKWSAMFEGRIDGGFSGQEVLLVTNFLRRKMKQIFSDNRPWSHATVTPSPNMVKHGWQSKTMIPLANCCRGNREGGFNRSRGFTMLEEMEGHCRH